MNLERNLVTNAAVFAAISAFEKGKRMLKVTHI